MNIFLTLTTSRTVKGGVETYTDHLKAAVPHLQVVDYSMLPHPSIPNSLLKAPLQAKQLDAWFMSHLHTFSSETVITTGLSGWALPRLSQPVINIQHGTYAAFADYALEKHTPNYWRTRYLYSYFEKRAAQKATVTIANSRFTRDNLKRYYHIKSTVIHNAIDTDTMKPVHNARKKLKLPAQKTIAIFVGRPDRTKGFDIIEELAIRRPDIHFLCVLPFPHQSTRPNISIHASVPHTDLKTFYSAADFCLNPTRFDGFGYVPLEALACNIPVIGTKTGIFLEKAIPGFHAARTINDYETLIPTVLDSSTTSRPTVKRLFSIRTFKKQFQEVFDGL